MSQSLGNGVSRVLSAEERNFAIVVWQSGKPPLDAELNLMMQADWERLSNLVRANVPSGWMQNPIGSEQDFVTNSNWSNFFKIGNPATNNQAPTLWANVNGWPIPVTGTNTDEGDTSNRVNLFPPPSTNSRIDLVFLEVWLAQVSPNPSELNKPSASTIYRWGNTEYGGANLPDDLEDPTLGFETTERVQLQYRLRVFGKGSGLGDTVDLSTFPDGLDDPNVLAQGSATEPCAGFSWENMKDTLGDPGLWRSGDGDASNLLGTVDGYSYAIPLCAVFRRNSANFVARDIAANANQDGALNRNPNTSTITNPVEGTRIFTPVTLTNAISATVTGAVQVEGLAGSGLDNPDLNWSSVFLKIGEEIVTISSYSTATSPGTITITQRGRFGTQALPHNAGEAVGFFVFRPDGRTADGISPMDILDLRKSVSFQGWDYQGLLTHNLNKIFEGSLHTSYKQAYGSYPQGPVVLEVDTLWANGSYPVPNQTTALDGPDGIREVFSDAAVAQQTSLILNPVTTASGAPIAVPDYLSGAGAWPSADFTPSGFQADDGGWGDGTVIALNIGGGSTNSGARATVRDAASNRMVRFLSPAEYWLARNPQTPVGNQTPFLLRFLGQAWGEPAGASESLSDHPGPMYPLPEFNFERPFIVLGGVVNSALRSTSAQTLVSGGLNIVQFTGVDFDIAGGWWNGTDITSLATTDISNPVLHGQRTLYDMLTQGGEDPTGSSSELYVVLTGDATNKGNAGVFRVLGAGTVGYTSVLAPSATDIVVERVGRSIGSFVTGRTVTAEVRSQYMNTQDGDLLSDGATAVIVITDIESVLGAESSPWYGLVTEPVANQAVLDITLQYGSSRGGTARVADHIDRLALAGVDSATLVREAPTTLDPAASSALGVPTGEIYFPLQQLQTWNHLPSLGLPAPQAMNYGEGTFLKDQRREAEVFFDAGSKTLVIRPYQKQDLSLYRHQSASGRYFPATYALGSNAGGATDGGGLFPVAGNQAYSFPWEFMPKFGRQDIPVHQKTGTSQTVYPGINHLLADSQSISDDVFRVLGGQNSTSDVVSLFIQTGTTSGRKYGEYYNMGLTANGYQGRQYLDVNNYSSDLTHKGLRGIQLPPFLGIARVYGIYDLREFNGLGAWDSDRVTLSTASGRPKNLLKATDKQTLYIVKGGASDVTGDANDHTYVIPEDAIDIRLSGQYASGDLFENMEFVVECVVFGFARGFINQNNFILARLNLPTGGTATSVPALADQVSCILPRPLPYNEQLYVAYTRTVYQGDPYMTRNGATKVVSDYAVRYGQIPQSSAFGLAQAIQQYDSSEGYAQVPEIPNARTLEVLASVDFYTTLGTGKMGGPVWPGTITDVGYMHSQRVPSSADQNPWQTEARTFSEGPSPTAPRATALIRVLSNSATSAGVIVRVGRGASYVDFISDTDFGGADAAAVADNLTLNLNTSKIVGNVLGILADYSGGTQVTLVSLFPGQQGVETYVQILPAPPATMPIGFSLLQKNPRPGLNPTKVFLSVPTIVPTNGGAGLSPIRLTGLTERLPLGILLQDSDFRGEDPLNDGASQLRVLLGGGAIAGATKETPLLAQQEAERVQGSGQICMADGSILQYAPWTTLDPTGTKAYRLYRGGGSLYSTDGGPVDFQVGGLPEDAVFKGGVLVGRAYLVKNFEETAFASDQVRSWGSELQMVIVTAGILEGQSLGGQISPTGYGEGMVAADRFRLEGKPLVKDYNRAPTDPVVPLAPYPGRDPDPTDGCLC